MSTTIFKTTLVHSNPQVVRQFQINSSRPIRDLLICVCLIHGWESLSDMEIITEDQRNLPLRGTIAGTLSPEWIGQYWYIKCPMRNSAGDPSGEDWLFRLDYLGINSIGESAGTAGTTGRAGTAGSAGTAGTIGSAGTAGTIGTAGTAGTTGTAETAEEQERVVSLRNACGVSPDLEPWLLRCRGQQPLYSSQSMAICNSLQQEMLSNGECYNYKDGFMLAENYMPDINKINLALDRRIVHGIIDVKIDRSRGEELKSILNNFALNDLKQMARDKNLNVDTTLRKYEFLYSLEKVFCQEKSWSTLVGAMDLAEYELFRGICLGTCTEMHPELKLLRDYCLVHEMPTFVNDTIPTELIEYFAKIAGDGSEGAIYKDKKIRMVLEACRKLYIVFSKRQAKYIAEIMFPDDLTDQDVEKAWGNRKNFLLMNPDVMYSTINLEEGKARELYNYLEEENIPYYTPEKDQLFEIVEKGFRFPENVEDKMIEAIRRVQIGFYRTFYNQLEISSFIYELYHLGWGRAAIEVQLRKRYEIAGSRKDMDNLFRIADASQADIRMVSLRGNTRREYNQMLSFRKREAARRKKG